MGNQKSAYKCNYMSAEHADLLNSVGFHWGAPQRTWGEMYQRLLAYKHKHSNTLVPQAYRHDSQLGLWVRHQRKLYKKKKMSDEHSSLLNSIGFHWELPRSDWNGMYERLVAYKKEHDENNVPQRDSQDPQLGKWVSTQRSAYNSKKTMMSMDRVSLLNSINFNWGTPRPKNNDHNAQVLQTYNGDAGGNAGGADVVGASTARIRVSAAHLHDVASSVNHVHSYATRSATKNTDNVVGDAKTGCNKTRRTSQGLSSRMLCAYKNYKLNVFVTYSKSPVKKSSADAFIKLFDTKVPTSMIKAATTTTSF